MDSATSALSQGTDETDPKLKPEIMSDSATSALSQGADETDPELKPNG